MIMILIKRYWKLFLIFISFSLFVGSMYFLYERNIYLEKQLQTTERDKTEALRAVESLKSQKAIADTTLKENTLKQAEIKRKLEENRSELDKLKRDAIRNKEKGSKCLNVAVPESINRRLLNKSNTAGDE